MPTIPQISFSSAKPPKKGVVAVMCGQDGTLPESVVELAAGAAVQKAIAASEFKGGFGKTLTVHVPEGSELDRVIVIGMGNIADLSEYSWLKLGGTTFAALNGAAKAAIMLQQPEGADPVGPEQAADFAMGLQLAAYRFDHYKTKSDAKSKEKAARISVHLKSATRANKAWENAQGVAGGVMLARDLVNEPPNVLNPVEFAKRAGQLKKLGCDVEILDEKAMEKLKMGALLGVSRGSRNPARMAIIQWKGGKPKDKPVAFVGKGVTFDTGGISLKPPSGMEDMKGDMGGAAAVTGLMHALASRKAKANVVGIIALVENMPDGDAQRPGDIVTSMSGQTIEIINTDAEGRLVLADALWHCNKKFKPKFMVNLATLTGAILVALGNHHAGLFSNDDELSEQLSGAGEVTEERVWRLPVSATYDKLIDSKFADMKNSGGRYAGSITAAQFLKRFVGDTPWAHLDVAGTAMGSPQTEINKSWASGFGVRLLDRLVADHYED